GRQSHAAEDLPSLRQVPVPERDARDERVGRPRAAGQHAVLVAEEDLRVLGVRERLEAGIALEGGRRPLPDVAALHALRGLLPFGLGRKPLPGPRRDGFGLEERDVLNGLGRRQGLELSETPPQPTLGAALPVERCLDPLRAKPGPAVVAPEAPIPIAAVRDELREALVRDREALEPERREIDDLRRPLVVVRPRPVVRPERERAGRNEYVLGLGRRSQVVVW